MHLLRFTSSSSLNCTIPPSRCVYLELAFSFSFPFSFSYVSFSSRVPQIFKKPLCQSGLSPSPLTSSKFPSH
ncbi:hypothetical protein N7465_011552 [Penicillium sp. CMV-2018d]|nr:hypothetical protein N7465_011552 [Penicillium sp. CMV-2018d]